MITPRTDKGSLMLISRENFNLIITRKTVHEGKNLTPDIVINDLIDKGSRIIILRKSSINITIINADAYSSLFIIDRTILDIHSVKGIG